MLGQPDRALLINDSFYGFDHHSILPASRQERISKNAGVLGSNLDWRTKSTETRPDGTERIVYSNARTQPMLEVSRTTEGGVTKQQGTYSRYNARGQAIWQVSPEAITLPASLAEIEQYPDLLNEVAGNFRPAKDRHNP